MLQEITFGLETQLVKFPARKHDMSLIFVGQELLLTEDDFAYYQHTREPSGFIPSCLRVKPSSDTLFIFFLGKLGFSEINGVFRFSC